MPWVSVLEAATECECSERTIRRRVTEGRLVSRTDQDGKTLVEIATAHQTPSRQMAATAAALTAQLRITTNQHAQAMTAVADAGMRAETRLAVVEKAARTNARTAILMAVAVVMCLAGAGIGWNVLDDRHRDVVDAAEDGHRSEIASVQAQHRTEIADVANDHQDVVLVLERKAATSDGLAEARADELARAADRLHAVTEDRDTARAAVLGETRAGVPILLAAEP